VLLADQAGFNREICDVRSAGRSATTVHEPGATSVNPPSRTTGSPLASSDAHCSGGAVRTIRSKSRLCHSERARASSAHHASCAAWPTCAMAFPAVMGRRGLRKRQGGSFGERGGGSGSSSSVPETCSFARSGGQSSLGTGGKTRISAVRRVSVMPGRASARRQPAPRARRTTLRMRPSVQAWTAGAHSPSSPVTRGSVRNVSTPRAAASRASVRRGGAVRSTRMTSGSAYSRARTPGGSS